MTNLVEFPGLGISIDVPRVAFTLFGVPIYWYGVCIGIGMLLALIFAFSQAKRFGIDGDRMVDVILIGFVLAIVCGRLYFVIFDNDGTRVYDTFYKLIDLRSGGIAIYGGILGAFVGAWLGCKWRKVPLMPMFDLAAMGFLIGQACGRWGNFFNQEAFGTNTTLPWGMISPTTTAYLQNQQAYLTSIGVQVDPNLPVHPTFLYESLWCALGFLLLFLYRKHRRFNGELFLFYVMWYGLGRFFIESLRTDPLMVGSFRVSQLLAALSVLAALCLWVVAKVRTAGKPLEVPILPPRMEKVKVETDRGVFEEVEISWPAEDKEPHMDEKRRMAMEKLAVREKPEAQEKQEKKEEAKSSDDKAEEALTDKEEDHGSKTD